MHSVNPAFIVAFVGIVVGPLVTYLVAARRLSGRIDTTEAGRLWEEAGRLRSEYKSEIESLRQLVLALRIRVADLEKHNDELHMENGTLKGEIDRLRRENMKLREELEFLKLENIKLKAKMGELESQHE